MINSVTTQNGPYSTPGGAWREGPEQQGNGNPLPDSGRPVDTFTQAPNTPNTPGNNPGNSNPGNSNPGNSNPGGSNPNGNNNQGGANPGSGNPGTGAAGNNDPGTLAAPNNPNAGPGNNSGNGNSNPGSNAAANNPNTGPGNNSGNGNTGNNNPGSSGPASGRPGNSGPGNSGTGNSGPGNGGPGNGSVGNGGPGSGNLNSRPNSPGSGQPSPANSTESGNPGPTRPPSTPNPTRPQANVAEVRPAAGPVNGGTDASGPPGFTANRPHGNAGNTGNSPASAPRPATGNGASPGPATTGIGSGNANGLGQSSGSPAAPSGASPAGPGSAVGTGLGSGGSTSTLGPTASSGLAGTSGAVNHRTGPVVPGASGVAAASLGVGSTIPRASSVVDQPASPASGQGVGTAASVAAGSTAGALRNPVTGSSIVPFDTSQPAVTGRPAPGSRIASPGTRLGPVQIAQQAQQFLQVRPNGDIGNASAAPAAGRPGTTSSGGPVSPGPAAASAQATSSSSVNSLAKGQRPAGPVATPSLSFGGSNHSLESVRLPLQQNASLRADFLGQMARTETSQGLPGLQTFANTVSRSRWIHTSLPQLAAPGSHNSPTPNKTPNIDRPAVGRDLGAVYARSANPAAQPSSRQSAGLAAANPQLATSGQPSLAKASDAKAMSLGQMAAAPGNNGLSSSGLRAELADRRSPHTDRLQLLALSAMVGAQRPDAKAAALLAEMASSQGLRSLDLPADRALSLLGIELGRRLGDHQLDVQSWVWTRVGDSNRLAPPQGQATATAEPTAGDNSLLETVQQKLDSLGLDRLREAMGDWRAFVHFPSAAAGIFLPLLQRGVPYLFPWLGSGYPPRQRQRVLRGIALGCLITAILLLILDF